jgi:hypothetical protein
VAACVFFLIFSSLLSFRTVLYNAVPTQDVTNPVSLFSFYCMYDFLSSLTRCNTCNNVVTVVIVCGKVPNLHHNTNQATSQRSQVIFRFGKVDGNLISSL